MPEKEVEEVEEETEEESITEFKKIKTRFSNEVIEIGMDAEEHKFGKNVGIGLMNLIVDRHG